MPSCPLTPAGVLVLDINLLGRGGQVTTHEIKGEVYEIERLNGCTEVIVNEGYREASYVLDEALIRFGGALDDGEYALAVSILEPLEVTPEVCVACV